MYPRRTANIWPILTTLAAAGTQLYFEAYLRYCGAQVTAMRSAEQALVYLSWQRVDAITTDVSVGQSLCRSAATGMALAPSESLCTTDRGR